MCSSLATRAASAYSSAAAFSSACFFSAAFHGDAGDSAGGLDDIAAGRWDPAREACARTLTKEIAFQTGDFLSATKFRWYRRRPRHDVER
eukprot:30893-Pelagococcus_subviridis.AAC.9